MTYLFVFFILLSVSINLFLIWYIRNLIRDLAFISSNITFLKEQVKIFIQHLSDFLSIELFSSEPVVKNLRIHAEDLMNSIQEFDDVLFLTEEDDDSE